MSNKTKIAFSAIAVFTLLNLSACGDSDTAPIPEVPLTPPEVNQAIVFNGPLIQTSSQQAEQFIKNGIYASSIIAVRASDIVSAPAGENGSTSNDNFSQTNTVEQGVDESDRLKYDGNHMYVAESDTYYLAEPLQPKVRVLKRNEDFTLSPLKSISSSLEFERIEGIYLHDNKLAVIGTTINYYSLESDLTNSISFPSGSKIALSIFDVANPEQSIESAAFELDGMVLATRRIENSLYIISTHIPFVEALTFGANSDADKINNFNLVSQTPIAELMPKRYQNGQQTPLTKPEDCYIPAQANSQDGYAQFVNVTKINLAAPTDIQSVCLTTIAHTLYMSPSTLYLAANIDNQDTLFHKIDLSSPDYSASGSVQGQLGWRGNPLFRMHENNQQLRVVTTDYNQAEPLHKLSILQQQGSDLTTIATLPNENAPDAIGKPGEDIYAVRFIDEKAYVVTFENIDPLYVINLSDGTNPFIEGSLEIPGFSSYIHPLDNDYLIGIGQQVAFNNLPQIGVEPIVPPLTQGMKISLFDVRDPQNPLELSNLVTPDAYTPVEFDYKALSVLNTNGYYQFALPLEEWGNFGSDDKADLFMSHRNSLMLLETDTTNSAPSLSLVNKVSVPQNTEFYYYSGNDRSIIQGDKVYYLRGNHVWLSDWSQDSVSSGPY